MKARYINPYTDFGFKKLFGEEANKNLLADFLNQLLPSQHKIVYLSFKNSEQNGMIFNDRKAVFDIYCENEKGERFIVEMQKEKLKFFKDRAVFYTTFPIREQVEKGEWNFKLMPIYCVAILDFVFDEEREKKHYVSSVQLKDQFCQVFYDKLNYIFIEMPRFNKNENELETHFDKWLYFLKNLENFDDIPAILREEVFIQGFKSAEIANFNKSQLEEYEKSLLVYWDLKGVIDSSFDEGKEIGIEEGLEKGREEGILKVAKSMKQNGLPIDIIVKTTGLTPEQIDSL